MKKRIYLEDKGQDLLHFDIDEEGKIIDCNLQKFIWIGNYIYPHTKVGQFPAYYGNKEKPVEENTRLKYKVIKIEEIKK